MPPRRPQPVKNPPLPRPLIVGLPNPVPGPVTRRRGSSIAKPWSTFGWPRAHNHGAWFGLGLGLLTLYLQWKLPWTFVQANYIMPLGAIGAGIYGEVRSRSWDLQGRGKWIARAAIALGGASVAVYLISFFFR